MNNDLIQKLAELANTLDAKGFTEYADSVDEIIISMARLNCTCECMKCQSNKHCNNPQNGCVFTLTEPNAVCGVRG